MFRLRASARTPPDPDSHTNAIDMRKFQENYRGRVAYYGRFKS
jgi:hypothetical protein